MLDVNVLLGSQTDSFMAVHRQTLSVDVRTDGWQQPAGNKFGRRQSNKTWEWNRKCTTWIFQVIRSTTGFVEFFNVSADLSWLTLPYSCGCCLLRFLPPSSARLTGGELLTNRLTLTVWAPLAPDSCCGKLEHFWRRTVRTSLEPWYLYDCSSSII